MGKGVKRGDILRNQRSGNSYVVDVTFVSGSSLVLVLVNTVVAMNPGEWERVASTPASG